MKMGNKHNDFLWRWILIMEICLWIAKGWFLRTSQNIFIGTFSLSSSFDVKSKVSAYRSATHDNFFCIVTSIAAHNISYGDPTPTWTYDSSTGTLTCSAGWGGEYYLYCNCRVYYTPEPLPTT